MLPFVGLLCVLLPAGGWAQRKNKKDVEPPPQILEVLPNPPDVIQADSARLSFQVSPLSANGLLSQQVRDALKALLRLNRGATLVKVRALVAGSGDLRRVAAIVSEEFSAQKRPLPAVSTIQVGALPLVGAQVVIEGISLEKKVVNPNGIALFSPIPAKTPRAGVEQLELAVNAAGVKPGDVLRVTCFLSSLDDAGAVRTALAALFPAAVTNYVQAQRLALQPQVACEAAGRLSTPPPEGFESTGGVTKVSSAKLVLSGTQLIFRDQDADVRLGFQRLGKSLGTLGAGTKDVIWSNIYAATFPILAKTEEIAGEFLDAKRGKAGTALLVEGLPSTDATASIEFVAVGR